ncbi:unnamed protein product [Lactuca virosa]|uniref:Defensin-like protein n=1 Tax=Lactuca virosa TaxID=75947 RepID=A0AAU9N5C9_9ASTR|nr:unnamed protein product [Lactuca virosa]
MANVLIKFNVIFVFLVTSGIMLVHGTEGSVTKAQVHPTGSCNMSLGPCSFECYAKCCAAKCQERASGVGICVSIGRGVSLCQCTYPCV